MVKKYKVLSEYKILEKIRKVRNTKREKNVIKNVRKCYVNSLAGMETAFMYNILYTKHSNLLLHFLRTLKKWSIFALLLPKCFGNQRLLICSYFSLSQWYFMLRHCFWGSTHLSNELCDWLKRKLRHFFNLPWPQNKICRKWWILKHRELTM